MDEQTVDIQTVKEVRRHNYVKLNDNDSITVAFGGVEVIFIYRMVERALEGYASMGPGTVLDHPTFHIPAKCGYTSSQESQYTCFSMKTEDFNFIKDKLQPYFWSK